MRARAIAFLFAMVATMLVSRSAHAEPKAKEDGVSFGPGLVIFQPNLASSNFSGSGVPYNSTDGSTQNFNHSGRQFGVHAPAMIGAEMRLDFVQRYYDIGIQAFAAGEIGDSGGASDPAAASISQAGSTSGYGGGIHFVGALPLGGSTTITFGPDMGVRGFSVPLTGFEPTTCHSKYGTYSCPQTATTTQPYFQPRLAIIVHSDTEQGWSHFFFAPWIGLDAYPSPSWAAGIMFGLGDNHNALR